MSTPSPPAAASLEPAVWRSFFSLETRANDDRRLIADQLRRWTEAQGVERAALYSGDDEDARLCVGLGGEFEGRLGDIDEGRWSRLALPGAVLVVDADMKVDGDDPALVLLAAAARISELKQEIAEQKFQARFRGVELQALYDVGLAIASTLDLEELCDEALIRAVSLLDARRGALYLLDGESYERTSFFGGAARERLPVDEVDVAGLLSGESTGPDDWLPGACHLLAVPVEIERQPRGLLVVADKESRRGVGPFPATDRRTLALFANQAAIALENAKLHRLALEKERLEREMELAAEIQEQILPKMVPEIPGFEVVGWNRPARHAGGDYFDVHGLDEGRWGLVVGDVTGKGLPAAMLVSTLHSALRVLLDRMEVGADLIERLNRHIYESSAVNKFITMLLASIDPDTARLSYLNAGHNPGLLVRADGTVEELTSAGLPLGLMPKVQYRSACLDLEPGDLVCLYSDGITECESPDEEEFGMPRLTELLREQRAAPLSEILATIDRAVVDFAKGLPQGDDQTVVLLRRAG